MRQKSPLARRREKATGRTLNEQAEKMHVSAGNLCQVELGRATMGNKLMAQLADAYDCTQEDIEIDYLRGRLDRMAEDTMRAKVRVREILAERKERRTRRAS